MKKSVLLLAALVSLNFYEKTEGTECFHVTSPLAEWPTLNPLSTQTEIDEYKKTWNYTKTLEENQKALADTFIKTCCDFTASFEKIGDIYVGRSNFMSDLLIMQENAFKDTNISIKPDTRPRFVLSPFKTFCPISSDQQKQINDIINQITESPVGCKLLRILVTKYKVNNYAKIIFTSTEDANVNNIYVKPTQFTTFLERNNPTLSTKNEEVVILPKNLDNCRIIESMLVYDQHSKTFKRRETMFQLDAVFFHEFSHVLSENLAELFCSTKTINERFKRKVYDPDYDCISLSFLGGTLTCDASAMLQILFANDEEYKNIFGLTSGGLYPINEALYTSAKYGYIRASHMGSSITRSIIIESELPGEAAVRLDAKQASGFNKAFIETYGDYDLYRFYLDPTYPVKPKCPKFGISQYQCSDLDPITGEKKGSVLPSLNAEAEKMLNSNSSTEKSCEK